MRQIFLELWIENKKNPVVLILKIILVLFNVCMGIWLKGYPYSILMLFLLVMLQSFTVKLAAQVEFLIPSSNQERVKFQIQKSAWIAGIYATVNALGYAMTISLCERYQWDGEMVLFMIIMFIFPFALIFNFRIVFERIRNFEFHYALDSRELKKRAGMFALEVFTSLLDVVCVFAFLIYKFPRLKEFLFLGTGYWKVFSLFIIGMTFVLLCICIWKNCRKITVKDYCG